jgi:hypothetical protein
MGTVFVLVLGVLTGQAGGHLVYQHGAAQVYVNGAAPAAGGDREAMTDDD